MGIIAKITIIIILSLILLFSLIHLSVSIAILAKNGSYGDLFRPEKGLAGFNIVISFVGLVVGGLGLFCVITGKKLLSTIAAVISCVLVVFALASLIAALVINSNSFNYINTYLSNNMNQYMNSQDSRNIIDRVQGDYRCCGRNMWLDWTLVQSAITTVASTMGTTLMSSTSITSTLVTATTIATGGATTPVAVIPTTVIGPTASTVIGPTASTVVAPTTSTVMAPTTSTVMAPTTSTVVAPTASTAIAPTASTVVAPTTSTVMAPTTSTVMGPTASTVIAPTTSTVMAPTASTVVGTTTITAAGSRMLHGNVRRDTNHRSLLRSPLKLAMRLRRQTADSSNSIISVAYSSQVSVPSTCCVNSSQSTCMSSSTNPTSQFYTTGCLQPTVRRANQQDMGIGIINSFMIVLALVAIPLLYQANSQSDSQQNNAPVKQINHTEPVDPKYGMSPQIITSYH